MSLLNSDQSNFIIELPNDFLFKEVEEKYTPFLTRVLQPYEKLINYLNATIQSVTFPEYEISNVRQFDSNSIRNYRTGYDAFTANTRQFTITFHTTSAFLNYFIMLDQLIQFISYENKISKLPAIRLTVLDDYGNNMISFIMQDIIIGKMSGLELSYSSDTPEFRTFTVQMYYSNFKITSDFNTPTADKSEKEKQYLRIK